MGMYRKKPVTVEANQWFKNGDHPDDYVERHDGNRSPEYRRAENWEGEVVRYYRHPQVLGTTPCEQCGKPHHDHGWIDTLEQGHRVCPGDWIITGVKGERYPCKPDIFEATYEPVAQAQQTTEPEAWNQAQVCTWIGNQLMTHPSMFERSEVCKFVRGLGRNAVLRSMFPKPQAQQQTTVEEPELPVSVAHISDPDSSDAYDSIPVYTAAQMHEHYAAGVRVGTATVKESLTTGKQRLQVPTGWAAPKDQYAVPVLFNPYTGEPRDVRDVQSDPQGILIVPPGKVHQLAAVQGGQQP